jgi:hypothetical protein
MPLSRLGKTVPKWLDSLKWGKMALSLIPVFILTQNATNIAPIVGQDRTTKNFNSRVTKILANL